MATASTQFPQDLPLPLARLVRRAANSKSSYELHHCGYSLAEASLKLGLAARLGLCLQRGVDPQSPLAARLGCLAFPSLEQLVCLLRHCNEALAALTNAAELPLARVAPELIRARPEWPAVIRLIDACEAACAIAQGVADQARGSGLLGLFHVVAAYRERVIGQADQRGSPFCQRFGQLFLDAMAEVLADATLLDGLELARPVLVSSDATWQAMLVWRRLTGLVGVRSDEPAEEADPGQPYLLGRGVRIGLSPLLRVQPEVDDDERIGFLQRIFLRVHCQGETDPRELRRLEYADYGLGDRLRGLAADEVVGTLLVRLRSAAPAPSSTDRDAATSATPAEPASETPQIIDDAVVIGDFEVLGELGRGGMGVVYKARQLGSGRLVALKVLPSVLATHSVQLKRFRREIDALSRCDHPNVVKVLCAGADGDRHYYAMEYVDGADLSKLFKALSSWNRTSTDLREEHLQAAVTCDATLSTSAPSDEEMDLRIPKLEAAEPPRLSEGRHIYYRLAELFADAADGLHHLHQAGVLHRDIKPGNLMCTADGSRIVIMDLGLARLADESQQLTETHVKFLGTLRYMAPEQLQRQLLDVDQRADVYGLGATIYELCTGRLFLDGDNEKRLIQQILLEDPKPALKLAPRMPRDLATCVTVATQKHPGRRYQSALDMAQDLRAVVEHRPLTASAPGLAHHLGLWSLRHRAAVAAAAVVLAILIANLVAFGVLRRRATDPCRESEQALAGVWDAARKEAIRSAFVDGPGPALADTWRRVEATVDRYAQEWTGMHREACEATRVRGEQPEEVLYLRLLCLTHRLDELRALGKLLASADVQAMENAVLATRSLTNVAECADVQALQARMRPPTDREERKAVEEIWALIAQAKALDEAGKVQEGIALASIAVAAATRSGHAPVEVEARRRLAHLQAPERQAAAPGTPGEPGAVATPAVDWSPPSPVDETPPAGAQPPLQIGGTVGEAVAQIEQLGGTVPPVAAPDLEENPQRAAREAVRAQATDPDQPVRLRRGMTPPKVVRATMITPRYPPALRRARVEGRVMLLIAVQRDGSVGAIQVRSGNAELAAAAVDAIKKWRFTPAQADGQAVAVWLPYPFVFELEN